MTIIRPFELKDQKAWEEMFTEYASVLPEPIKQEEINKVWDILISDSTNNFGLIATNKDHKEVGFAHYMTSQTPNLNRSACYLQDLFVKPEDRKRGIASTIIHAIYAISREEEWHSVHWPTDPRNDAAQSLYNKMAEKGNWVYYEKDNLWDDKKEDLKPN